MGLKGITESALSAVLQQLRDERLLSHEAGGISRRQLARDLECSVQLQTVYGFPVQTIPLPTSAGDMDWDAVHPGAVLNFLAARVPEFGTVLKARLAECPCSPSNPWSLIYYCDEASAGNLLHIDPARKSWLFYWSFLEMGHLLSYDSCWFLGGVLRYQRAAQVAGGFTTIFRRHLQMFFGEDSSFKDHGFSVHCADGTVIMLWARLKVTLADEAAMKAMWSLKGSAGTRPCAQCANVVNHRAGLDLSDADVLVSSKCSDTRRFVKHTNESLWRSAEMVSRPGLSVKAREELETQLGVKHAPESVLMDPALRTVARPAECITYDPMHCLLCNGALGIELYLFLEKKADSLDF